MTDEEIETLIADNEQAAQGCENFHSRTASALRQLMQERQEITEALRKAEDGDFQQCLANYRQIRRRVTKSESPNG